MKKSMPHVQNCDFLLLLNKNGERREDKVVFFFIQAFESVQKGKCEKFFVGILLSFYFTFYIFG